MNKQDMQIRQLEDDRDYWKARCMKMKSDVEFFVGITLITIIIIAFELIINRYFPTN